MNLSYAIQNKCGIWSVLAQLFDINAVSELASLANQKPLVHRPIQGTDPLMVGMAMRYALIDRLSPLATCIRETVAGRIMTTKYVVQATSKPALYYACALADKLVREGKPRMESRLANGGAITEDIEQMISKNHPGVQKFKSVQVNPALGNDKMGADCMLIADQTVFGTKTSAMASPVSTDDIIKHSAYVLLSERTNSCAVILNRQEAVMAWMAQEVLRVPIEDARKAVERFMQSS